jgi:3-dehydrosphinganine reductase
MVMAKRSEPSPPADQAFAGRHAVITGGSSGIGLATAGELLARGADVSVFARGADRLEAAAGALREAHPDRVVLTRVVDVADRDAVTAAIAEVTAESSGGGPCDVLITSAGLARPGYFHELPDEVFREMIDVDYFGTLWPIRAVVPSMIERRSGSVVGVASAAGLIGVFGYTAYGPAKFAVRGLFEALRQELAPHGVHVGCVYPPDVDTPQLAYENQFKPSETRAISGAIKPLTAEAVARTIVAGIERRRFSIIPDVQTSLLARTAGLVPEVYAKVFDRQIRGARRR